MIAASFNGVAMLTLIKREMVRSLKIINQVIWPPVITTLLYVFVFGVSLGGRIRMDPGTTYAEFLIPGLIMLQVIDSSYGECSSSVFQGRFMNSIQEILIAPMSAGEMVFGYVLGSLVRALLIANMIMALGLLLVHTLPREWWLYFGIIIIVSLLFSGLGVIFGLLAEKFDHLAVLTTFAITPLVFVGSAFTPAHFLSEGILRFEYVNPMFYAIDAFRHSYTGASYLPLWLSVSVLGGLMILALSIALRMAVVGYKLRT
ncbi:MAG TPA: ABC transporter permease [Candidatus Baltobacteraceae bacterium]|nr:ABC transporter permease [Candidatus Baltobacteraceae bacterium]